MRRRVCLMGVALSIILVWGSALALSCMTARPFHFESRLLPGLILTALTATPFLLTASFLGRRLNARRAASSAAVALLLLGSSVAWSLFIYAALTLKIGPTGRSTAGGFLLLLAPLWLTTISVAGFTITDSVVRKQANKGM